MRNILKIIIINMLVILITIVSMDLLFFYNMNDGLDKNSWFSQYIKDTILTKSARRYYSALYKRQIQDNSFVPEFRKDYIVDEMGGVKIPFCIWAVHSHGETD